MQIFDFQQVINRLLSLQKKKSCLTAAVIVAFTVFEIKKTKNFMKLEYILFNHKTEGSLYRKTNTE